MAISSVIDTTVPDGATQNVSVLDNAIRQHKIDVGERMDDSLIDTSVAAWANATQKELIEGLARIFTTTAAAKPTLRLFDGKLWVRTLADTPITGEASFQVRENSAWEHVPIGEDNILADAIVTAGIVDAAVTTAKTANNALIATPAEVTDNQSRAVPNTQTSWGIVPSASLSITHTPESARSLLVCTFQALTFKVTTGYGAIRIRNTTSNTTLASARAQHRSDGANPNLFLLTGYETGVSGAQTIRIEAVSDGTGGDFNIEGDNTDDSDTHLIRFRLIELKSS